MKRVLAASFVLSLAVGPVMAGPVADFETAYDATYSTYRTALFVTNTGDATKSAAALGKLDQTWTGLMAQYRASPPPQYEADPLWDQTMAEVSAIVGQAKAEVASGDLPKAHGTLEAIRAALGSLHARNNVETFSDRMNAYHAEMEAILASDTANLDASRRQILLEHSAVLSYLAADVLAAPPASATDSAEFATLAAAFQTSVDQFVAAARSGDDTAITAAIGGLKVPYAKLFLKFG